MIRVGWWVVFDEQNDEGATPGGFYIDDDRAAKFADEPGWLKNHLEPVYRGCEPREGSLPDRANPARDESPKAIEPGGEATRPGESA